MTETENFVLASSVLREMEKFEEEMLDKDSEYLYENAREIYATKFIGDCLADYDFLKDKDYTKFPKRNIVRFVKNYYLLNHDEIRTSDLEDMLKYDNEFEKAVKDKNMEM